MELYKIGPSNKCGVVVILTHVATVVVVVVGDVVVVVVVVVTIELPVSMNFFSTFRHFAVDAPV
jgi:hypothetical protein